MKRIPIILFIPLLILIGSCKKNEIELAEPITGSVIPTCIQTIIDSSDGGLTSVRVQEQMNENHYWLNTNALFVDGNEYVVNAQCDTVCVMSAWFPNDCQTAYVDSLWVVLWEN